MEFHKNVPFLLQVKRQISHKQEVKGELMQCGTGRGWSLLFIHLYSINAQSRRERSQILVCYCVLTTNLLFFLLSDITHILKLNLVRISTDKGTSLCLKQQNGQWEFFHIPSLLFSDWTLGIPLPVIKLTYISQSLCIAISYWIKDSAVNSMFYSLKFLTGITWHNSTRAFLFTVFNS